MSKAINDDVCIKGSTLVIGITFPKVDDTYSLQTLLNADNLTVKYYIINTDTKVDVTDSLYTVEGMDTENARAFTISDTTSLHEGVLMVEITAQVPAHGGLPARTEIARCSTGIAIIK